MCLRFLRFPAAGSGVVLDTGMSADNLCQMIFCLAGDVKLSFPETEKLDGTIVHDGWCSLQYVPWPCRCTGRALAQRSHALQLTVPGAELARLLGENGLQRRFIDAKDEGSFVNFVEPISPQMHVLIDQMKEAVKRARACCGPLILAKGLELLWLFSDAWSNERKPALSPEDMQSVDKARRVLEKRLADPPSLENLASQVGMSLSRFKDVFRRAYEMPPYAYLRKARMERAMCKLCSDGARVTEVAMDVGYNSVSHFAKAFSSHYGVPPSKVRKAKIRHRGG
jgi:AraC-like DNA-binding protein